MRPSVRYLVVLVALFCLASPSLAWGTKGHAWVVENAIRLLPEEPLRTWLEGQVGKLTDCALIPDFQLRDGTGGPLEAPNHFYDFEAALPSLRWEDIPRTRLEATRHYTEIGLGASKGGFLPYRVEELYVGLENAFRADPRNAVLHAGLLAHYVADGHMPLHVTVDYDGRTSELVDGRKRFQGIHAQYEIAFVEDYDLGFRERSFRFAAPPHRVEDAFAEIVTALRETYAGVDPLYVAAEAYTGEDWPQRWDEQIGELTAQRLANAASLLASYWQTAWEDAGKPALP